jgi:mono/diheme cytochrome c family protein
MTKKSLFSIAALFDSPDAIIHAAEAVRDAGYTRFDVNTPYPVHGMDNAMGLRQSRLGFFTLAFGLLGALLAVGFMTWVSLVDYPLVIGGKPSWPWPAFVPVAFELTVLLASVLSVVAMIVVYFKFPNNSHPLHDTAYMKSVSSDRFGVSVQADDPKFNAKEVESLLKKLHAVSVEHVYFEEEDSRPSIFEPRFLGVLAVVAIVASITTYGILNHVLTWAPFNWMSTQAKLKPQRESAMFADGIGMRAPVAGTVARGFLPYAYAGKPEEAGKLLVNPLPSTKEVLERGQAKFKTFCSPCHGNFGDGDSRLRGQFPNPPTLHSDKVRGWTDGRIFAVITEGQNSMPSYAAQVSADDRWAVINYVRVLQRSHNAKESDLK